MNFVPLTNWANHANSDETIDMQYFESEMSYWIKNMSSYEKIFYRITPIFLSNEVVHRAMILEDKLIHKNNTRVHSYKLDRTEFNVLIPNTKKILK